MHTDKKHRSLGLVPRQSRAIVPRLMDCEFSRHREDLEFFRVLIVNMTEVRGEDFRDFLLTSEPRVIVDLRYSPKFDEKTLGRHGFFDAISAWNALYLDTFGLLQIEGKEDCINDLRALFELVITWVKDNWRSIPGGMLMLTDKRIFSEELVNAVESMPHPKDKSWDVETHPPIRLRRHLKSPHTVVTGSTSIGSGTRADLFISHANPEDNDFALWLSAKLRASGYQTWVDLENLRGGSIIWEEIEEAIRYRSAKFIFLQSEASLKRSNVLNEVDLAVSVERKRSLKNFVIPIRVDKSPFDDTYIALRRKLLIDCSSDWKRGLISLLKILDEDCIPRTESVTSIDFQHWRKESKAVGVLEHRPDEYISNWYEVIKFPEFLAWSSLCTKVGQVENSISIVDNNVNFFFSNEIRNDNKSANTGTIELEAFMQGTTLDNLAFSRRQARWIVSRLTRQAWDNTMTDLGLCPYRLSGYRTAWYWPDNKLKEKKISYVDAFGINHSRLLVGRSRKYNVCWHFAVEAKLNFDRFHKIILRPHVVFTKDGNVPLDSPKLMHRLRRSFCKNWWNDRWRDLIGTYVQSIAATGTLTLRSGDSHILVDACPIIFVSPLTSSLDKASAEEGVIDDVSEDLEDDTELEEFLNEHFMQQ